MVGPPGSTQPRSVEIAAPVVFQQFEYPQTLPNECTAEERFVADGAASLNAVRIITKNLLALVYEPPASIDWTMNYLVVALPSPVDMLPGDGFSIRFNYRPGGRDLGVGSKHHCRQWAVRKSGQNGAPQLGKPALNPTRGRSGRGCCSPG